MGPEFHDRRHAGLHLAALLVPARERGDLDDAVVLGLARGGVPVAHELAHALALPLDVFVVRKLGTPGQPELAMGAIASGGARFLNEDIVASRGLTPAEIEAIAARERRELERRERLYRGDREPLSLAGRAVILVDDGLATGASMLAAVAAVRALGPRWIVVAVPTAAASTVRRMQTFADEVVCVTTPHPFFAVGQSYEDFSQTSDDEVRELLR